MSRSHEPIELRAYELWEDRGRPLGTPEVDWFQAERELSAKTESAASSLARDVGTAIGAVVALLTDSKQ